MRRDFIPGRELSYFLCHCTQTDPEVLCDSNMNVYGLFNDAVTSVYDTALMVETEVK
jgi:hypothetical protein